MKLRTPLKSLDVRLGSVSATATKPTLIVPQLHRESILERKLIPVRSGLPVPNTSSVRRKVLFNKPNALPPRPHQTKTEDDKNKFTNPANILPPLTKLTRESFKQIPRESLAWMAQLPRESATFAELEKLMTDDDKKIANEDDTDSFEAMEKRMKTPSKTKLIPNTPKYIVENKENISEKAVHSESNKIIECAETVDNQTTESQNEIKSYRKKHELFGNYKGTTNTLSSRFPVEIESSSTSTSDPSTPINIKISLFDSTNSSTTPISCELESRLDTPLTPGIKCLSTTDLAFSDSNEQPVQLARCASANNIAQVVSFSDLVSTEKVEGLLESLNEYEDQLKRFREEQDALHKQEEELMKKIKQRKQQFKALWGVSPLRINTKRTIIQPRRVEVGKSTQEKDFPEATTNLPTDVLDKESPRRVRFNSGRNETRNLTPVSSSEFPAEGTSSSSLDISGCLDSSRSNSSNQSFASLKSSFSFLQTPLPPKKNLILNISHIEDIAVPKPKQPVEPTPIALRKLGDRVKAEFAALYAESDDTDEDLSDLGGFQEKLCF